MNILETLVHFFVTAGPFLVPQVLLLAVILILSLVNFIRLSGDAERKGSARNPATRRSVDAVLFWGGVAAVVGFMGTWSGLFRGFEAMRRLGLKSFQMLFLGLSEAHITTAFGLGVLLVAGFLWLGLRLRLERGVA